MVGSRAVTPGKCVCLLGCIPQSQAQYQTVSTLVERGCLDKDIQTRQHPPQHCSNAPMKAAESSLFNKSSLASNIGAEGDVPASDVENK